MVAALRWWLSVRLEATVRRFRFFDLAALAFWWTGVHDAVVSLVDSPSAYEGIPPRKTRAGNFGGVTTRDFTCGDGVPCRDFEPSARSSNAVLIYMHGGGWCMGRKGLWQTVISQFVRRLGCRAVSVGYRRSRAPVSGGDS